MQFFYRKAFSYTFTILFGNVLLCRISAMDETSTSPVDTQTEQPVPEVMSGQHEPGESPSDGVQYGYEPQNLRIPYASSPLYLTQLAKTEHFIYQSLLQYENQLLERLGILQRLRTDYETGVLNVLNQIMTREQLNDWSKATVVSSHPILAYRMIRRFAKDLKALKEHIWQSLENGLWQNLELYRGRFEWPSESDLLAISKSLIRLQDTHDFNINHFTDGVIRDHYTFAGLTARQCLEISEAALQLGEINAAAEWFQAAHLKSVNSNDNSITMDDLTQSWEKTYQAFQSIWPMHIFTTHDVFKEAKQLLQNDFNRVKMNLTKDNSLVNFKALCRGEKLLTDLQTSDHTCYLENSIHPYFFMNPLKIEMYSWQPLVYKVHNFLGPKAVGNLSHVVVPSMVSIVEAGNGEALLPAENAEKTYSYSILPDYVSPSLSVLTERITALLGNIFHLNTLSSDHYQISAYAVGNHYDPCTECFQVTGAAGIRNAGRTASTVHIVLHEPQKGGELAFPLLGVSITPSIGSAIVHNEVNIFGKTDERTLHGSCPVLMGEKWTATKLIHEVPKERVTLKEKADPL